MVERTPLPRWLPRRGSFLALLLWSTIVLSFLGQFLVFRDSKDSQPYPGYLLMFIGLAGFVITTRRMNLLCANEPGISGNPSSIRIRVPWLVLALGSACLLAWRTIENQAPLWEYLAVWGVSLVALVLSFRNDPLDKDSTGGLIRWDYLLLAALLLAALLLRGIRLDSVPHVLDDNEALFALGGADIRLHYRWLMSPFLPGFHSYPVLHSSLIAISTALFGLTRAGARIPSVLLGSLGIPAIYLLGRELFGWRTGLVSALFALAWAYQVQFSRLALNQVGDPLFATLAFYFLLRGLRRGAAADYVLSGIMLGLSQLFYLGGRLAPLVMLSYLAFIGLRQRRLIQSQWRLILLVPFAALVATFPQNYYLLRAQEPLTVHTDPSFVLNGGLVTTITDPSFFAVQVRPAITALFSTADRATWYGPSSNLMGLFGGPLLLFGVVVSLFTLWKHPRRSLPLGWMVATAIGGSMLSVGPPEYQRYFSAVSALALLAGMGLTAMAVATIKFLRHRPYLTGLLLSLGGLFCFANLVFYVVIYVPEARYLGKRPGWVNDRLALDMQAESESGKQIVLVSNAPWGVNDSSVVRYYLFGKPYLVLNSPTDPNLDQLAPNGSFIFYIPPERKEGLEILKSRFPGGAIHEVDLDFMTEDGSLAFYTYITHATP